MGFAALFSGVNFSGTIKKYCSANDWSIADLDNKRATLKFRMNSGRRQTVYIIRYESTLEFSVPSMAIFESENSIPHYLSTLLLKRSAQRKVGFWCIETINGKHVFSCMHNAEMELIDSNYFAKVVRALINECDAFEETLIKMRAQKVGCTIVY
jgi:hypothetical protein